MSIHTIKPSHRTAAVPRLLVSRDCGPAGCEIDWLTSRRVDAQDDIEAFTDFSMAQGWGDGLPLVPPTDARVRAFLSANDRYPDEVIARMPDSSECTVEKIVINAVMAGAPARLARTHHRGDRGGSANPISSCTASTRRRRRSSRASLSTVRCATCWISRTAMAAPAAWRRARTRSAVRSASSCATWRGRWRASPRRPRSDRRAGLRAS